MNDLYLYHATFKEHLNSIISNGLVVNPPQHHYDSMDVEDKIFLALDAKSAVQYINEAEDNLPDNKEIVVFKISLDSLDESSFSYDWNNRCEYQSDINSVAYEDDIPYECLIICDADKQPRQTISDFRNTELYNTIMDVFDYEVETNMEMV